MRNIIKFSLILFVVFLTVGCVSGAGGSNAKENITFNTMGGNEIKSLTGLTAGDTVVLPQPEKEGYMFIGWYESDDFVGKAVSKNYTYNKDVTLYAYWRAYQYRVTYQSSEVELSTISEMYFYEDELNLLIPTSDVYNFVGWYLGDEEFTMTTMPSKDIILTAKWEPKKFTITLDVNGGMLPSGVQNAIENVDGGTTVELPVPTKAGHIFRGWYTSLDEKASKFDENTIVSKSITLYAKFDSLDNYESEYNINYELLGGSFVDEYPATYKVGEITTLVDPVKEGYTFIGWYESPLYIGEKIENISDTQVEDITLYAKWHEVKDTYQVTFINHLKEEITVNVPSGEKVEFLDAGTYGNDELTWYLGNRVFDFETAIYEDIVLYANWKGIETNILTMVPEIAFDNIELLTRISYDSSTFTISWKSSDEYTLSTKGVTNPDREDTLITLTAKITHNGVSVEQPFNVIVPKIEFQDLDTIKPVFGYVYSSSFKGFTDTAKSTLDVVNISFGRVSDDGTVDMSELRNIEEILQIRKTGTRVVLCIGGYGSSCKQFSDTALTAEGRTKFAASILELVERYHFDGVDIDWEYPGYETGRDVSIDRPNFTLMMAQIANTLKSANEDYIITAAVPGGPYGVSRYDVSALNDILDYIHLMTYDFHNAAKAVHHAALFSSSNTTSNCSAADSVRIYVENGASIEKLVIGVAFYGRVYILNGTATTEKGVGSTNVGSSGTHITYTDIVNKYYNDPKVKARMIYYYDTKSCAPTIYDPETNTVISFDDANSISAKCQYVWNHNLAGLMYWENGEDTTDILLNAINKGMK